MTIAELAARDNAEWCDTMCRAHGSGGAFAERAWTSAVRTPLYYPDAVTLSPAATAADVLGGIDAGPGASVKDSFATLDLPGFDVLFEARWIHHPALVAGPSPVGWEEATPGTLPEWERACFDGEVSGLFPAALLAEVSVLSGRIGGELVCGCVLTPRERVVGVSNVFATGCDEDTAWAGVVAAAAARFPGRPLVGYEQDPSAALRHGFETAGPLRVWLKG
ncbi:hypothetical protein [Nonomuraea wenchangensis]|uniref:N-acetyltransferase domain-containing protein n=1 Tax=Nonomuraea wenchangensis TaxID=568860 RepID=A0A1I0FNA9_9ACTN|nr:hypothetical protein [Nonomuraea wenchangensis]SET59888.1 hypothetical protein SAMN05421811_103549 [Nonomuraea wenchangensis]